MGVVDRGREVNPADLFASRVRTIVPVVVGSGVAYVAEHWHIIVPDGVPAGANMVITGLVIAGYYELARRMEHITGTELWQRGCRFVGRWMLGGIAKTPTYTPNPPQAPERSRRPGPPRMGY